MLNDADKVVVLAGVGALGATAELIATAGTLGAPIVKTLPGTGVVPDDHPLPTGGIGLLSTRPSHEAMESCDTLLMVGTIFPYTAFLPRVRCRARSLPRLAVEAQDSRGAGQCRPPGVGRV